jgi:hypothetical protein
VQTRQFIVQAEASPYTAPFQCNPSLKRPQTRAALASADS